MTSLFTVGVLGKNLGIGCQLEDAGLLLGTRTTDTNKEFSAMCVSPGKTNPEASWTILTASWCPVVLILRPEVCVGSHCAQATIKGLTTLFKMLYGPRWLLVLWL